MADFASLHLELKGLERTILKENCSLEILRSGSRLRVIKVKQESIVKGYGKGISLIPALLKANDDYLSGHLKNNQLGSKEIIDCRLDLWIVDGNKIKMEKETDTLISGYLQHWGGDIIFQTTANKIVDILIAFESWLTKIKFKSFGNM